MADMMAIVSKAIFEKAAGKHPAVGDRLQMDRYVSANKALEPLRQGGRLYLVTVRPPDEALWLVAILETPKHDGKQWLAEASSIPITDISKLRSKIKFESGVGITEKKGALGMSLQTPRALTAADTTLLDQAAGVTGGAPAGAGLPPPPSTPSPIGAATGERRGTLLDAILEDPASDEARQVYADQLIANNDPRGELILLEIALAGPLSIRKREQLAARRKQLVAAHGATWWPYTASHWRTQRGFLAAVHGTWAQIAQIAPKLFAAEPVTEVSVSIDDEDELAALLKASWLPRLHRLIVRGMLGDDGFIALCKAKQTAKLRALNVTANDLTGEAFSAIKNALPRLDNLVLTGNEEIGDDGIAALRTWKRLPEVTTLYLSGCGLGEVSISHLFAGAPLHKLEKLTLSNNWFGDDGATVLVEHAARMPALEHLELVRCGISSAGAQALAAADLPKLRRLDVRYNNLDGALASDPRIRV